MFQPLVSPRFTVRVALACASLLSAFSFASAAIAQTDQRPNIILIMADDLGYGELGSYGQTKIRTPHLDQLAGQGMRFTQHYTSAPVCAPARCSLMTGKHGGHAIVRDNLEVGAWDTFRGQLPLPDKASTIAEVLKSKGYATGAFGKWGLGEVGSSGDPLKQGFDRFFGYNCQRHAHNYYPRYLVDDDGRRELPGNDRKPTGKQYAPQVIADELLKFIRKNQKQSFFVYYPSVIPHLALQAPAADIEAYAGQWEETPYRGKSYLPHNKPRAAYAAMITFLDKQVGRIVKLLKELKLSDNTVILFTSDNGATFLKGQVDYEFFDSVDGLRGLKGSVYEGGIRVPLIANWPGRIRAGTVSDHPCAHYDLMATLADLAGAPTSPNDGVSITPTLLGKPASQRQHPYLVWDYAGYGGQLAIREGKWKGVQRNLKKKPDAPFELYDLEKDRAETTDLAEKYPEVARRLAQHLLDARDPPTNARFRFGDYE
jgi:arylsulfatase A-like enzyme